MMTEPRISDHRDTMLALPWYANGTLETAERMTVEAHLAQCAQCRQALAQETRLANAIAATEPVHLSMDASREALARMMDRHDRASWLRSAADAIRRALTRQPVLIPAFAAALMAMVFVMPAVMDDAAPYRTLTAPQHAGPSLKVLLRPEAGADAIAQLAARHALVVVSGPSEGGVYTLAVADDATAEEAAQALSGDPLVDLVDVAQ